MNDTDRQTHLSTAFHEAETIVAGHAMRPLSLASYDVLLRTGNPLVKGEMPTDGTPEFTSAIMGFVFTHCAPWPEVVRASFNDQGFRESALIFCGGTHPGGFPDRFQTPRRTEPGTGGGPGRNHGGFWRKKVPPCDEPGFLAAQVFAVAAETGWPEERILFMPLARLAQYQHCLLRRNGVRTNWCAAGRSETCLREQLEALRGQLNDFPLKSI